jgi:hypothetical protein
MDLNAKTKELLEGLTAERGVDWNGLSEENHPTERIRDARGRAIAERPRPDGGPRAGEAEHQTGARLEWWVDALDSTESGNIAWRNAPSAPTCARS